MTEKKRKDDQNWKDMFWKSYKYNERTKIKSGTYLHSFCPYCQKELTDGNVLSLNVIKSDGQEGKMDLSPYLNTYTRDTDIKFAEGEEMHDLLCPHCKRSLKVKGKKCGLGDSHVASFLIGISNIKVPFYICMRTGCRWHAIYPEDESKIILDGSDEW